MSLRAQKRQAQLKNPNQGQTRGHYKACHQAANAQDSLSMLPNHNTKTASNPDLN